MENNILKEYIEELNEKIIFYKTIGWETMSKYVKKDGLVNFKAVSKEDRVMFDNNNKFLKSETYKLKCVYELFPQIIEGYSLA